jgi:hypothetical protein
LIISGGDGTRRKIFILKGDAMTEQGAVKAGNAMERFFERLGHDARVVFESGERLVETLPKYIQAAELAGGDVKEIVPLVQAVITASLAFAKPAMAIAAALGAAGANLAADEAAISALAGAAGTLDAALGNFVAAVKALAEAIGADWKQVAAELGTAA